MPFLTLLDDRVRPKGSRDPLGFEIVWTYYGRRVIGNLTTITSSLENFTVALLGFHLAHRINDRESPATKQLVVRNTFLRYEQLAGYLRFAGGGQDIMGVTRITRRMSDRAFRPELGLEPDRQILSDQVSYGLWGLYSSAMRDSGLIAGDDRMPTELGSKLATIMTRTVDEEALVEFIVRDKPISRQLIKKHAPTFVQAVQSLRLELPSALLSGGHKHRIQKEVWRLTQVMAKAGLLDQNRQNFIDELKSRTVCPELKDRLADIEAVERVLVASNNLFEFCRAKDGASLASTTSALAGHNLEHLSPSLDLRAAPRGKAIAQIRDALCTGNFETAIRRLLKLNYEVMQERDGAPWVELDPDETLRVRVPSETACLKSLTELKTDWDYNYFLTSYQTIAHRALVG